MVYMRPVCPCLQIYIEVAHRIVIIKKPHLEAKWSIPYLLKQYMSLKLVFVIGYICFGYILRRRVPPK